MEDNKKDEHNGTQLPLLAQIRHQGGHNIKGQDGSSNGS